VNTLGLGVCVVFRSGEEAELFEASRNCRRIDWTEISARLRFSTPISRERRSVDRYELHKELFEMVTSPSAFSGSPGQQISGLPQPVAHSYGWLAGWLFDRRLWDRCSHATAIRSGAAAAAAPGSSTQRGPRVSREEAFDLLGSFLGCLLRISSAQLASLDSVRDRLIDLRWNPRLTSTGQQCPVLK
jgi:hypothetical protein